MLREREDDDDIGKGEGGEWDGDELLPSAMLIINGYNLWSCFQAFKKLFEFPEFGFWFLSTYCTIWRGSLALFTQFRMRKYVYSD